MKFLKNIEQNPIIAAVRSVHQLAPALASECGVLFLLSADITTLHTVMEQIHKAGKQGFVHADLMEGIARDRPGIQYLKEVCNVDGIITTQSHCIRLGREMGLPTIQRLFVIDSQSIHTGSQSILQNRPDAVEIMPGIMPRIVRELVGSISPPVIAGGLLLHKEEAISALDAGAVGVSTSSEALWNL